ncbi:protein kinase domain-containing protein [Lachnospiraceae bacterium C1.1]|nr:serine/threonine protein kinase [Lachnospiraceae bacterium C1.1]
MNIDKLCPHCMEEIDDIKAGTCPHCHKSLNGTEEIHHQLKPMSVLAGKYLVGDVLGEGGFGITYIGLDLNLEMKVAIKEFYPNGYATRESKTTTNITIYSGKNEETIKKWRENFIKEARSLAKFSGLKGVVGVKDFFQENNTAYIIMEYVEGETLKNYMKKKGGKVEPAWVFKSIEPVMLALGQIHKTGIIHRDISPDNLMLMPDGSMKLLDFGAARSFEGEGEKSLSVMLKPGYAPEEQYRSHGKQGPWSDVYALGGTIYKAITGVTPPESMERLRKDELLSPKSCGISLSESEEKAILKAMAVLAENRYQSMEEFHEGLYQGKIADTAGSQINSAAVLKSMGTPEAAQASTRNVDISLIKKYMPFIGAAVAVMLIAVISAAVISGRKKDNNAKTEIASQAMSSSIVSEEKDEEDTENKKEETAEEDNKSTDESGMNDPLTDEEKYAEQYEQLVGAYWNGSEQAGWNLIGLEIFNLNAEKSDVPEILTLWEINDANRPGIYGQTIFGIESSKEGHKVTSSAVYGYNFEIFGGDNGSTIACVTNESGNVYLVDSEQALPFSIRLQDESFQYSVRGDYVGRVPAVYERASKTPASWSPDNSQYYKVTADEANKVLQAIASGKKIVKHRYTECNISYQESGTEKDADWQKVWDEAWKTYEKEIEYGDSASEYEYFSTETGYEDSGYVTPAASDGFVNLREGPGTEYDIITPVYNGEELELSGYEEYSTEGRKWLYVYYYESDGNMLEGYVAASQVRR